MRLFDTITKSQSRSWNKEFLNKLLERDNPTSIGNRVKSARMLSGYTRQAFATVSEISMSTLRIWEEPSKTRSGLSLKGANRLVKALNSIGIFCTSQWLLNGTGPGPNIIGSPREKIFEKQSVSWGEDESILKDIAAFKLNNTDPIVAIIQDGSMLPKFSYSDYVGGSKLYGEDIAQLIGRDCIIGLEDKTIVRRIVSLSESGYTLSALNQDSLLKDTIIVEAKPFYAAEIVWHRWKRKINNIIV